MKTDEKKVLMVEEIKAIQQTRRAIFRLPLMGRGLLEIPTPFMMSSLKSPSDLEHTISWIST